MSKIERREFITKSSIAVAGGMTGLMFGCGGDKKPEAANINLNKTFEWQMVTAWPPNFPLLGEGANLLAKKIEIMSGGKMKIRVYGGGELVPALESFDAVSQGVAQMGHAASYYWAGKAKAAQFFTSIPFGMNTQQTNAWMYSGGGIDLWNELYSDFDLTAFPCGNTGAQMGGWFNKEINSTSDLKGLKMRFPGIGGKVLNKAGGTAVLSAGGEIYTNLERGVIDATDWIGPYHDYLMGFPEIAKYYYYPSWAERTGVVELMINKSAFDSLPEYLKVIIKEAAVAANTEMVGQFDHRNAEYLQKIQTETDVQLRKFPQDVINTFRKYSAEAVREIVESDPMSRKVYQSYSKFKDQVQSWSNIIMA